MKLLWLLLLHPGFPSLPALADIDLCEEGRKFLYGCDPIEPLYQIRVELSPDNGGVELGYSQTPLPPEVRPTSGNGCALKKRFETSLKSGTATSTGVIALATLGSEIRLTNLGTRPVKLSLTGSPEGEPLPKGETRKFTLSTAEEVRSQTLDLSLWRAWEVPEKKKGKTVCAAEAKKQRVKVQVLALKARAEDPGLWEESPTPTATPSPLISPVAPLVAPAPNPTAP